MTAITTFLPTMTGDVPRSHHNVSLAYFSCRFVSHSFSPAKSKHASRPLLKYATTCLPSVAGEGFAPVPLRCFPARPGPSDFCQACLPSKPYRHSASCPSVSHVTKMVSSHTTGEELPGPGSSTFQATP